MINTAFALPIISHAAACATPGRIWARGLLATHYVRPLPLRCGILSGWGSRSVITGGGGGLSARDCEDPASGQAPNQPLAHQLRRQVHSTIRNRMYNIGRPQFGAWSVSLTTFEQMHPTFAGFCSCPPPPLPSLPCGSRVSPTKLHLTITAEPLWHLPLPAPQT